jgi:hypothetical protein
MSRGGENGKIMSSKIVGLFKKQLGSKTKIAGIFTTIPIEYRTPRGSIPLARGR